MQISTQLKHWRQNKKLTAGAVANRLGIPVTTYRNWESGDRHPNRFAEAYVRTKLRLKAKAKSKPKVKAKAKKR